MVTDFGGCHSERSGRGLSLGPLAGPRGREAEESLLDFCHPCPLSLSIKPRQGRQNLAQCGSTGNPSATSLSPVRGDTTPSTCRSFFPSRGRSRIIAVITGRRGTGVPCTRAPARGARAFETIFACRGGGRPRDLLFETGADSALFRHGLLQAPKPSPARGDTT